MTAAPMRAAAEHLRVLRQAAGLSQEALADRSGVSERTIRTLEAGRALRPHHETLRSLAVALGLAGTALADFVELWRSRSRRVEDLFVDESPEPALRAEFARQRSLVRERSFSTVVRIGADGHWHSSTVRRTFDVVGEGLDRFLWLTSYAPEVTDPDRFEVRDCANVDVGPGRHLPNLSAKAWEGSLSRTLPVGASYSLGYTYDYASALLPDAAMPDEERTVVTALTQPMGALTFEVHFDPRRLPARVHSVSVDAVGGAVRVVDDLAVSAFGVVTLLLGPVDSGTHGIRWEWDGGS